MLPLVGCYEDIGFKGDGAANVNGIHAAQYIVLQARYRLRQHCRSQVADRGILDVGQQKGLQLSVLHIVDLLFPA